ncbi:hypothetical protein fugu_000914 [Takifugu bimaculatus]|uniref:non-specific serine/threonine protein kinase n=1 Tax=Takifugu bimaculatus TaxID=433685 RepID=A0A4Z2CI90_9TELE|nr:hypothetical protein fugu_000914 [Takifugu bimaculatus]
MPVTVETTVPRMHRPVPVHFSHAEQSFSLRKRRQPQSSSSSSNSTCSSPARLSHSLPPQPPSKGCPPLSRIFQQQSSPWTPLSCSLAKSPPPNSVYDPSKQQSYFNQCFTSLGLLGRGSFGEVYKVQSNKDGRQYAVKRSANRFRGNSDRNRSVREARNHERLCPHPHILGFVSAWEECGRLYIQTELCSTSLLFHADNHPVGPDESTAWGYLCDLLSALEHLHSLGFVHLDLKPANVLMTASGRLKLGDFGLLLELEQTSGEPVEGKGKDEMQEGDPSLGVTILELACNIEVPNGGEGWQQLRQGCLPSEITSSLSHELQSVLQMMLNPDPTKRPTVSELLNLPSVWKYSWKRRVYLMFTEAALTLASICQLVVCFGCRLLSFLHSSFLPRWSKPVPCTPPKDSWDKDFTLPHSATYAEPVNREDDAVFLSDPINPEHSPTFSHRVKSMLSMENTSTPLPGSRSHHHRSRDCTPTRLILSDGSSRDFVHSPPSILSNGTYNTLTPSRSPVNTRLRSDMVNGKLANSRHSPPDKNSQQRGYNWIQKEEALPRPNFEPKNLLSLFEETTP